MTSTAGCFIEKERNSSKKTLAALLQLTALGVTDSDRDMKMTQHRHNNDTLRALFSKKPDFQRISNSI